MQRVCEFLEIPYDASLATLEGANREAIHPGEHHQLLRGTQIITRTRSAKLEGALAGKISRYVHWWQRRNNGVWPRYPVPGTEALAAPSLGERLRDKARYCALRGIDAFTRLAFCRAPLPCLRRYRGRKRKAI
jgi:hypothetical protein